MIEMSDISERRACPAPPNKSLTRAFEIKPRWEKSCLSQ
jgi:hypothetical protein